MDNNMFQRLKDLVTQFQTIGIVVAPNPTLDEMAAGLGMYLALKQMGKNVAVACPTDVTVGVSSLVGIDKVQKGFGGGSGGDLVVTFPYREGEIEKVSYTVDNGQLNIVVKAGANGLSFTQQDVQFKYGQGGGGGQVPQLLFFIGVADPASVQSVVGTPQNTTIVNIDNKPENRNYGDAIHVSTRFSSVSEMVADFLTLLEPQIELDVDTSQNLLSGILSATNNFENGKGSYLAFEMAGILMKKGAVRSVSGMASPMSTPMQTNSYFPPQPSAQPAPVQPQVNNPFSSFEPAPAPNVPNPFAAQSQPFGNVQSVQPAPAQPTQQQQQPFGQAQGGTQAPSQPSAQAQDNKQQPPADWLTPKVYKGSTVL